MGISEAMRERRRSGIGSSDVAALFGLDPFQNERDVWVEKVRHMEGDDKSTEPIEIGNWLEGPLIDWTSQTLKKPVRKNQPRRNGIMLANLDAIMTSEPEHVEAKTTGNSEGWGEGDGDVPAKVVLQVHHQFICANTNVAWVPVIMPGYRSLDRRIYRVELDQELASVVLEKCESWWKTHVAGEVEPDPTELPPPHRAVLARVIRQADEWVEVDDALLEQVQNAKKVLSMARKEAEIAERNLLAAMGDAEGARPRGPGGVEFTYFQSKGRTSFGTSDKYTDQCETCGVGTKVGKPYRTLRQRKRSD